MITALLRITNWLAETNELTSDSKDYKIIQAALNLIAYHVGHEQGIWAGKDSV